MRLPEPTIRTSPQLYAPLRWPTERSEPLPPAPPLSECGERRSIRKFSRPSIAAISALLWHTARRQESLASPPGFDLQLRPIPSAGAIHPIHLLLEHPESGNWTRYDPRMHALDHLPELGALRTLRDAAGDYVNPGPGVLVLFAAEPGLTTAKYGDAASLVWRDAGVLQGAIALLAPSTGLGACLLGLTGHNCLNGLGEEGQLVGVGTAILGAA